MPAARTPAQLKTLFNDTDSPASLSSSYLLLLDEMLAYEHVISETTVDLTVAATTNLFTVPAGYILEVAGIEIEGVVTMSGGTASVMKILDDGGTIGFLNGTTGATFTSGTATSLIPVGVVVSGNASYAPASVSVATKKRLAAAKIVQAVVSGTVITAGSVKVRILGRLLRT